MESVKASSSKKQLATGIREQEMSQHFYFVAPS